MSHSRILLSATGLEQSFGARTLFTAEKLEIRDGDRIGLAGVNGCGKTTLLRLLAGELTPDSGQVQHAGKIAWIRQPALADTPTTESGGERTRQAISEAFSANASLLFADEPTTNLDLVALELLERQLRAYPGAVVLVSHDRTLLDAICTAIWAIEDGTLRVFPGNYSAWAAELQRQREFQQFEYTQYQQEKQRLTTELHTIRQQARNMTHAPSRMGNSEARLHKGSIPTRQKQVQRRAKVMRARIDRITPHFEPAALPEVRMSGGKARPVVSRAAARVEGLTVRYGARTVLENASFTLPTGTRTVMLGDNGAGKTTLAAHLAGGSDCAALAGGVKLGYFAQQHELLDPTRTVLENVRRTSSLPESDVRTILARLGLAGEAVFQQAALLSGGERAKAAFALLLASDCNLLIFDEPTNHIDFYTAEALEELLLLWPGTLLVITHDRHLAKQIAQRLLFVENAGVRAFEGNWVEWQQACAREKSRDNETARLAALIDQMRRAAP